MCAADGVQVARAEVPEGHVAAQVMPVFSEGEEDGRGVVAGALRENLDALTALLCGGATDGRVCGERREVEGQVALLT